MPIEFPKLLADTYTSMQDDEICPWCDI
jgi:hypothetical protein